MVFARVLADFEEPYFINAHINVQLMKDTIYFLPYQGVK
jgi:hypothetical protein